MRAVILAAGRGSRMNEMTDECPKCLLKLHGCSLLELQVKAIRKAGINQIAIVTGYKREMFCDYGLVEFHNPRWEQTNMVASLVCASEWLESSTCIVSYSDIFYDSSIIDALQYSNAELAVSYGVNWRQIWQKRFKDPLIDAETFLSDNNGCLLEIGKKPKTIDQIEGQYMGLLRLTPDGWRELTRVRNEFTSQESDVMHMTDTLQKIINIGQIKISTVPYDGVWGEVDSAHDLAVYHESDSIREFCEKSKCLVF